MRTIFLWMFIALISTSVCAEEEVIPFEGVQTKCVQVGEITFGPSGRWADCHVTRGRWVATIDFLDLYQAQYCLGKSANSCDKRAFIMFANRAYTPDAAVLLVHIDDGTVKYDDPRVVRVGDEAILSVSAQTSVGIYTKSFYLWRTDHWIAMEQAQSWMSDLTDILPKGTSVRQGLSWPDTATMTAQVSLFRSEDLDCCPSGGVANVELGLVDKHFTVMQMNVDSMTK